MADQFLAEIRIVGFNFAPKGWAFCDGQILPISQNTALFSLLGTNYGGNGTSNFALPNLQGKVAIGVGQGAGLADRVIGEDGGSATVTLAIAEMPAHTHTASGVAAAGAVGDPTGKTWAEPHLGRQTYATYAAASDNTHMAADASGTVGGQPHNNMPPYLVMNYVIAMQGIYPQRP